MANCKSCRECREKHKELEKIISKIRDVIPENIIITNICESCYKLSNAILRIEEILKEKWNTIVAEQIRM